MKKYIFAFCLVLVGFRLDIHAEECVDNAIYPICDYSRQSYYLSLFGGYDLNSCVYDDYMVTFNPKPMGGICFGYKFNMVRAEAEFSYRRSMLPWSYGKAGRHIFAGMANAYVDFFILQLDALPRLRHRLRS